MGGPAAASGRRAARARRIRSAQRTRTLALHRPGWPTSRRMAPGREPVTRLNSVPGSRAWRRPRTDGALLRRLGEDEPGAHRGSGRPRRPDQGRAGAAVRRGAAEPALRGPQPCHSVERAAARNPAAPHPVAVRWSEAHRGRELDGIEARTRTWYSRRRRSLLPPSAASCRGHSCCRCRHAHILRSPNWRMPMRHCSSRRTRQHLQTFARRPRGPHPAPASRRLRQ